MWEEKNAAKRERGRHGRSGFIFGSVSKQQLSVPCLLVKQEGFSANSFPKQQYFLK